MTSDPIEAYQQALRNLESARKKVDSLVAEITSAAYLLERWQQVMVSNVSVGFPPEVAMQSGKSINAEKWPTAQQLAEALSNWHSAHKAVGNAWSAIPANRRVGLEPPAD